MPSGGWDNRSKRSPDRETETPDPPDWLPVRAPRGHPAIWQGSVERRGPSDCPATIRSLPYLDTTVGSVLLNADCSVMPVQIFTADHRAATITRVVDAMKSSRSGRSLHHAASRPGLGPDLRADGGAGSDLTVSTQPGGGARGRGAATTWLVGGHYGEVAAGEPGSDEIRPLESCRGTASSSLKPGARPWASRAESRC